MQFLLCRIDFANKKPLYTNAKRLYKISFPSLVGQNGDFKQAVLLTLRHRLSGLPNFSVTSSDLLGITVAGPCRHRTDLPY